MSIKNLFKSIFPKAIKSYGAFAIYAKLNDYIKNMINAKDDADKDNAFDSIRGFLNYVKDYIPKNDKVDLVQLYNYVYNQIKTKYANEANTLIEDKIYQSCYNALTPNEKGLYKPDSQIDEIRVIEIIYNHYSKL